MPELPFPELPLPELFLPEVLFDDFPARPRPVEVALLARPLAGGLADDRVGFDDLDVFDFFDDEGAVARAGGDDEPYAAMFSH